MFVVERASGKGLVRLQSRIATRDVRRINPWADLAEVLPRVLDHLLISRWGWPVAYPWVQASTEQALGSTNLARPAPRAARNLRGQRTPVRVLPNP